MVPGPLTPHCTVSRAVAMKSLSVPRGAMCPNGDVQSRIIGHSEFLIPAHELPDMMIKP